MFNFFRRQETEPAKEVSILVKWGQDRFQLPTYPSNTKFGVIRSEVANRTSLEPNAFKLLYSGAIMKDDNATLSAFQLPANVSLTLIGSQKPIPTAPRENDAPPPREKERRTEESTIAEIQREVEKVKTDIGAEVDSFLVSLQQTPDQTPETEEKNKRTQLRLSEILLQSLLRLDALPSSASWETARKERREGVRTVQTLLDRLDEGWRSHNSTK